MRQIRDPITASFENFDFVVEALDKTAGLTVDEIVRDLIHPVFQGRQETVKATEPAPADTFHPTFDRRRPGFLRVIGLEDRRQLLAQVVGSFQVRRTFEQQRQLPTLFLLQVFNTDRDWSVPGALTTPGLVRDRAARGKLDANKRALLHAQLDRVRAVAERHRNATGPGARELHRVAQWLADQWTASDAARLEPLP